MPLESAEGRGSGTRLTAARGVGRRIENGIAIRELVNPGLEVRETEAEVEGQPLGHLPVILDEELVGVICNVVDTIERSFIIVTGDTEDLVSVGVSGGIEWIIRRHKLQLAVRVIVRGLRIADAFPVETRLDRMGAHNLGERITHAGHVLVGIETR